MGQAISLLIVGFALLILMALLMALPTMLLWNWLMPLIFGLSKLTFMQALGVNLLSGCLFKSSVSK